MVLAKGEFEPSGPFIEVDFVVLTIFCFNICLGGELNLGGPLFKLGLVVIIQCSAFVQW
jgi:hypothetical protein